MVKNQQLTLASSTIATHTHSKQKKGMEGTKTRVGNKEKLYKKTKYDIDEKSVATSKDDDESATSAQPIWIYYLGLPKWLATRNQIIFFFFASVVMTGSTVISSENPSNKNTNGSCDTTYGAETCKIDEMVTSSLLAATLVEVDAAVGGNECGIYMAESAIPNAGWGMYTAKDMPKKSVASPLDVAIPVLNFKEYDKMNRKYASRVASSDNYVSNTNIGNVKTNHSKKYERVRYSWLMQDYYWTSDVAYASREAKHVDVVIPGYGMLANSHPGYVNLDNMGPKDRSERAGSSSSSILFSSLPRTLGAYSRYQNQTFETTTNIAAGDELFAEYGDEWFEPRFPEDFPLSADFDFARKLVKKLLSASSDLKETIKIDLYELVKFMVIPKLKNALPVELVDERKLDESPFKKSVPWLQENGLCLDNMQVEAASTIEGITEQNGAFATRDLSKGSIVAPAPLIHMNHNHLRMIIEDEFDKEQILWNGYQLLLNYCYGHPSTSLLFFPYSPVVNLINHDSKNPNVELRWSTKMSQPQWLNLTAHELLKTGKAGLMMEFVAISDIEKGEEVRINYGPAWEVSYQQHGNKWKKQELHRRWQNKQAESKKELTYLDMMASSKNHYISNITAWSLSQDDEIILTNIPIWIQPICWIPESILQRRGKKRKNTVQSNVNYDYWHRWKEASEYYLLSEAVSCRIVKVEYGGEGEGSLYSVILLKSKLQVKNVPRRAISFTNKAHSSSQSMRNGFRHYIQLPDEMIPNSWKDLKVSDIEKGKNNLSSVVGVEHEKLAEKGKLSSLVSQCELYLAKSSIPNAGLGMYTAKKIEIMEQISYGDVVVQLEDINYNGVLRRKFVEQQKKLEQQNKGLTIDDTNKGISESYIKDNCWQSEVTFGSYEADHVDSMVPGLGMLGNSHLGCVNAHMKPPIRVYDDLIPYQHVGVGSSSIFHGSRYIADMDIGIEAGSELLLDYGNNWFIARQKELGKVPLRHDYTFANTITKRFLQLTQINVTSTGNYKNTKIMDTTRENNSIGPDLWDLILSPLKLWDSRIQDILPKYAEAVPKANSIGSGKFSLPNRVRPLEWLEENGKCLDNIKPGKSTNNEAGRGAFATRRIPMSTSISTMPLLPIHRSTLEVYDHFGEKEGVRLVAQQLFLNYCYGHKQSSLLFFPTSPIVNYVNHHSSEYNAELRWSTMKDRPKDLLTNKITIDLLLKNRTGLIMDMVATRDILPNEEIFLNYGDEWDIAWKEYAEELKPRMIHTKKKLNNNSITDSPAYGADSSTLIREYNNFFNWVPTKNEEHNRKDLFGLCYVGKLSKFNGYDEGGIPEYEWFYYRDMYSRLDPTRVLPCTIRKRSVSPISHTGHDYYRMHSINPEKERYSCMVHPPEQSDRDYYDAQQLRPHKHIPTPRSPFIVNKMPRRAIEFFHHPYTSPTFMRGAFRHEIGIPDNMIPEHWKDMQ